MSVECDGPDSRFQTVRARNSGASARASRALFMRAVVRLSLAVIATWSTYRERLNNEVRPCWHAQKGAKFIRSAMAGSDSTFRHLITNFTDFLTVAIHTILYERSIYPQTSFLSARKYNLPVRQSRHPKVCEWINDAVAAVETELLKCAVDRVAVMIYDKKSQPKERYVFDVSHFPALSAADLDVPMTRESSDGQQLAVLPIVDMEEQFRAALSKLAGCSSTLGSLPDECTFTVAIELRKDGGAPVSHPQPWIPAEPRTAGGARNSNISTKPVRTVTAGEMVFETWIERVDSESNGG